MKVKMTKMMTAVAIAAVVLCSCGTSSEPEKKVEQSPEQTEQKEEETPEQTVDAHDSEEENGIYEEQVVSLPNKKNSALKVFPSVDDLVMDSNGNIMALMLDEKSGGYVKVQLEDGKWVQKETPWLETINQEHKNFSISKYWYNTTGELYVKVDEMKKSWAEYLKSGKKWSSLQEDQYIVRVRLFKIKEETNEMTEVPVPKECIASVRELGEYAPRNATTGVMLTKGVISCDINTFGDGNLFIESSDLYKIGSYSSTNGEEIAYFNGVIGLSRRISDVYTGSDFFVFVMEGESDEIEVHVVSEEGELRNVISTGIDYFEHLEKYSEDGGLIVNLCIRDNVIGLTLDGAIYEANIEDDAFRKVVDAEKDHLPYLKMDDYYATTVVGKDPEGNYAIGYVIKGRGSGEKLCYYRKKKGL